VINWLLNNKQDADAISFGGYVTRGMALFFMLLFLYQLWIFLHICWWIKFNPASTAFMEDRLDLIQEKKPDAELKHKWVDYKKISIHLKRAVIAAEDAKFLDHEGFDWEGIQKAYEKRILEENLEGHRQGNLANTMALQGNIRTNETQDKNDDSCTENASI